MQHPREKSSCWTVTPARRLPALPELEKGLAGYSGTCEMMLTQAEGSQRVFLLCPKSPSSQPRLLPVLFLVLKSCCILCNFYSPGERSLQLSTCVSCEAIHHSSLPSPSHWPQIWAGVPNQNSYSTTSLNIVIGPGGHLTCQAKLFSGLYTHTWRGNLPSTDSPS